MLKNSFSQNIGGEIRCVGFDLDGTLYDEEDFISQAYHPIAKYIGGKTSAASDMIYEFMCKAWRERGSSYGGLFQEAWKFAGVEEASAELICECVRIYRQAPFNLTISPDISELLDWCALRFQIFLVTDGNTELQKRKIDALKLNKWFSKDNTVITGAYGKNAYKPSTAVLKDVSCIRRYNPSEVLYCGDREADEKFAVNAGFGFAEMKSRKQNTTLNFYKVALYEAERKV